MAQTLHRAMQDITRCCWTMMSSLRWNSPTSLASHGEVSMLIPTCSNSIALSYGTFTRFSIHNVVSSSCDHIPYFLIQMDQPLSVTVRHVQGTAAGS